MRILKFLFVAVAAIIVVAILALWIYSRALYPQYSGDLEVPGLEHDVEVIYDDFGIPHIYGQNAGDTYFALGYVHAQDRLFQMDLLRRVGGGRLSEFFGETTLEVDRLFHTLGIPEYSAESAAQFDELDLELQTIVLRYLDGVNHFAETGPAPLEYLIGGLPREPFTVQDIYQTAGYMAFSFAVGLRTDPLVQEIHDKLGPEYLQDLALNHYPEQAVVPSGRGEKTAPVLSDSLISQLDRLPLPLFMGSNTWAVSGTRTKSGKPILANDTHIKYSQPSTWFEAHLEFPGKSLYGNFLAGIPLALVGHNRSIAWGLTMFENDDTDFYFEEFHPEDSSKVRYSNELWAEVEEREVIIKIKGPQNDTLLVRKTPHGPIVNEFFDQDFGKPVSMYWTYLHGENELPSVFYNLNFATGMDEAREAVKRIHAPGLNISYADTAGNIALWSAAHLIHRPENVNSKLILDGASGKDDPLGFYPFAANPQLENPESGMVYSANSQHDTTAFGVMHPGYYTANVRMQRIAEMLEEKSNLTVDDMKPIQNDHLSKADAELAKTLYATIGTSGDKSLSRFFEPLKTWEGDHDLNSTGPVLYYPLLYHLMHETFADELGDENFEQYLSTHLMKRTNFRIFMLEESVWFDDLDTERKESKSDIVLRSAKKAMEQFADQYPGNDLPQWGDVHTIEFEHPMGSVSPLDKIFNIGPFPIVGTNESVNQQSFMQNDDGQYPVLHGPQMRILIDMADIEGSISINPTGQSGILFSEFYSDQAEMFVNGQFRPQLMNRQDIEKAAHGRLKFVAE